MRAVIYILLGAALTAGVSVAAGRMLIDRLRLPLDRGERIGLGFLLGSVLVSNLVFLLCAVHLARKGWFLAAGLAVVAAAVWQRRGAGEDAGTAHVRVGFWKYLLLAIGGAYGVLYFFNAMAPEISPDGSSYHLGLVARYLREHGFHRLTTNMYAALSQGVEMLYLFAFAIGRHSAAAMVHFTFLIVLAALMILYARRSGMLPAGICGALFVLASPIVGIDGISAYIDVAVAAVVFGVFYLLEIWDANRSPGLLVAIGLLAGFAYAAKYTAALAVPYAMGFVAWRSWRGGKPVLKPVLIIGLCAAAVMAPWMVKDWIWMRNPFSPFLNSLFPNPYIQVGFEHDYSYYMRHYDEVRSYLEVPWLLTVDGRLSGLLGPLFLLTPVALLALRRRTGRRLLGAAAVFGATWFLNVGARFLIPALPFVALALAMVVIRWKPLAVGLVVLHAIFSWPGMIALYCHPQAWRLSRMPIRAALRLESEDEFLDANLQNYRMARLIERTVPRGASVLSFSGTAEAYTTRDILTAGQAASNDVLRDILWTPLYQPSTPDWILEFRFPAATVERIRVLQQASGAPDQWSVSELRVFRGGAELERSDDWRLRARPNPWEVQNAFDNTPVTRWRTWLPVTGREFIEVNFGKPREIDQVRLECTRDQYKVKLRLEGRDANGAWRTLADAPVASDGPPMPRLRRMATEEVKLRGVSYLEVGRTDFGSDDFRSRMDQWGIVPVGMLGEERLYRIE